MAEIDIHKLPPNDETVDFVLEKLWGNDMRRDYDTVMGKIKKREYSPSLIAFVVSRRVRKNAALEERVRHWMADCAARALYSVEEQTRSDTPRRAAQLCRRIAGNHNSVSEDDRIARTVLMYMLDEMGDATNGKLVRCDIQVIRNALEGVIGKFVIEEILACMQITRDGDWALQRLVMWMEDTAPVQWVVGHRQTYPARKGI